MLCSLVKFGGEGKGREGLRVRSRMKTLEVAILLK